MKRNNAGELLVRATSTPTKTILLLVRIYVLYVLSRKPFAIRFLILTSSHQSFTTSDLLVSPGEKLAKRKQTQLVSDVWQQDTLGEDDSTIYNNISLKGYNIIIYSKSPKLTRERRN